MRWMRWMRWMRSVRLVRWARTCGLGGVLGLGGCGPGGQGDGEASGSEASTTEETTEAPGTAGPTGAVDSTGEAHTTGHTGSGSTTDQSTTGSGESTGTEPACVLDTPFPAPMAEHTLMHGGLERSFVVYVPPGYDHQTPTSLVFAFHGYANSPEQQEAWSGLSLEAAEAGFILVYPRGTGIIAGWNAGDCCLGAGNTVDDVGFTAAMIDQLESELCIDPQRVYATGFSNGGFLSHRLACELGDRIAAIASVAGVMGIDDCEPVRPMPVLHMHGTGDPVVPYDGSVLLGFESVAETIAGWVVRDGCAGEAVVSYQQGDVTCERREACAQGVEVELCTIEGGGHTWPGGADIAGAGPTTQDLSANARLWEFFEAHPLP